MKKNKILLAFLLLMGLICGVVYGNVDFLKGQIFAETNETSQKVNPDSSKEASEESSLEEKLDSSEETRQESNPVIESEEKQVEKGTARILDNGGEVSGVPLIQKVNLGEGLKTDLKTLFKDIKGTGTKLKSIADFDSTQVGFQWVEATLIDDNLKEATFKIPVSVYDSTTIFNEMNQVGLDAKDKTFTVAEIEAAISENRLTDLILQESKAKSWQMEDGEEETLRVASQNISPKMGNYVVTIQGTSKARLKNVEKKIRVSIIDEPLEEGWEIGSNEDQISRDGYKIEWNKGLWWYTYNGTKWMYLEKIGANLILNGLFPPETSDSYNSGFLMTEVGNSIYSIHRETNTLRRSFIYLKDYRIDINQQLLENNAVKVTYQVTNMSLKTQKIGISQFVDTFVGSDDVPVTPINDFKGINLSSGESALAILPDKETMPNWAAGRFSDTMNFAQYNIQNANGLGWETGNQYRDNTGGLLNPPRQLKENHSVNVGDSAISMKNPGVNVESNESTSFKQILKYGVFEAPKLTLNQTKVSMYQHEEVAVDGTISDEDNKDYKIFLEMDDVGKTLIELVDYTDIPYSEVQNYQGTIKGNLFTPGVHNVSVFAVDEYGTRSVPKKIELTVHELSAVPKIQKVKIGEAISNDMETLFKDVKGKTVLLKNELSIDSSAVGFQWVEATLLDYNLKEITEKIPVSVYNPDSTVLNDTDNIALDAKDVFFELVNVRQSAEEGTLDELVRKKVEPKAWNMEDGTEIPVELISNGIQPIFGNYSGMFKGTRADSGKSLQKISHLAVGGELKFKELPEALDYKTTKLSQKTPYVERLAADWKIELENTIGSNWALSVRATPFNNQVNGKLNSALILKKNQTQDVVINETNQKIATGSSDEAFPTIQWTETAGLLLKVNPDSKVGRYQGDITWELSDAP